MSMHTRPRVVAMIIAVASLVVAGCGDDDGGPSPAGSQNGEPGNNISVPFTDSPEDGLPSSYPNPKSEDLKIGLLSPLQASEVVKTRFDAAADQVRELGGEPILLDAEANPDLQVTQFEQLINQEVDAIGVLPITGPKLLAPLLERAATAEIPVVGILSPGEADQVPGFISQIWQARDRMAYLQVKAAAEALPEDSQVGYIGFALPVPLFVYAEERTKFWADEFGLDIVDEAQSAADTIDAAEDAATELIAGNPEIVGILGYADEAAIGASLAARAGGREIQTFGVNATSVGTSAIENGRLTASVFLDTVNLGRELARGLYGAAQALEIPPVVVATDHFIVTADNVDDVGG